jgi:phospholipid/cholesterol/gamma-HCH transport system permease protein
MTAETGVTELADYVRDQTTPALASVGGFARMCVLTGKALLRARAG